MYKLSTVGQAPEETTRGGFNQLLCTLGGAVQQLTQLHHLGLYRVPVTVRSIAALGQLVYNLPASVTELTLSTTTVKNSTVGVSEKLQFFRAVAVVVSLKELHMPEWEQFVGEDSVDCVEPWYGVASLETVYVQEVKENCSFPPGLSFKVFPK